jgi:hypothetical protein
MGNRTTPFLYKAPGQLASIGRRTGIARIFGLKISGVVGWVLWRTVYLMNLPRLEKKLRVGLQWALDVVFERDLGQYVTLRDVESLNRLRNSETTQWIAISASFRRSIATFWFGEGRIMISACHRRVAT